MIRWGNVERSDCLENWRNIKF